MVRDSKTLKISLIFGWFREDFSDFDHLDNYGKHNGVVSFCYSYLPKEAQQALKAHTYRVQYLSYDWSLNEQP